MSAQDAMKHPGLLKVRDVCFRYVLNTDAGAVDVFQALEESVRAFPRLGKTVSFQFQGLEKDGSWRGFFICVPAGRCESRPAL